MPATKEQDVDAIWQEMKRESLMRPVNVMRIHQKSLCGNSQRNKAVLAGGNNRHKDKKVTSSSSKSTTEMAMMTATTAVKNAAEQEEQQQQQQQQLHHDDKSLKLGVDPCLADSSNCNLARELNRLSDAKKSVRKHAALQLERFLLDNNNESQLNDPEVVLQLSKPLFKRFNDPVEKVREVALRITIEFMQKQTNLLPFLPYLMPAIAKRLDSSFEFDEQNQVFSRDRFLHDAFKRGRVFLAEKDMDVLRLKPSEPSEEIRLLFLSLVQVILSNAFDQSSSSLLHAYIYDVLLILVAGIHDSFHEINIKSCEILTAISNNMVSVMKHFSVAFVRELRHLLVHRLARVKISALQCIQQVVACPNYEKCKGSGTEAIDDLLGHREENVIPVSAFYSSEIRINLFAKLDQDPNALVRKTFFEMVTEWLVNLPDRYDFESKLMPYVLSAIADENDSISSKALQALEFLGQRYEQEHAGEIIEKKQYGVDGNPSYNYNQALPKPWITRPSLGSRLFVRSRTRRFLGVLLRELGNWQCPTRQHAARLLKCVMVYSEETITVDAHLICSTLHRCWRQSDLQDVQSDLQQLAELSGRFVLADTYLDLLLDPIQGGLNVSESTPHQIRNALEILQWFMQGSLPKTLVAHIPMLLQTLSMPHLASFESAELKTAMYGVVERIAMLLEATGQDAVTASFLANGRLATMESMYQQLFQLHLVTTVSVECKSDSPESSATNVMRILRKMLNLQDEIEVYNRFFPTAVDEFLSQVAQMPLANWSLRHSTQLALELLLQTTSTQVVQQFEAQLDAKLHVLDRTEQQTTSKAFQSPRHLQQKKLPVVDSLPDTSNAADCSVADPDENIQAQQQPQHKQQEPHEQRSNIDPQAGDPDKEQAPEMKPAAEKQVRDPRRLRIEQLIQQLVVS